MSSEGDDHPVPKRFRRLRFNPLRDVLPWASVALGIFATIRAALNLEESEDPVFLIVGPGLIVLGILLFFINRWQAKRGL